MNRFSSEYLYILQNSFSDDFWIAILSSFISLLLLLIALIALGGTIFLIISLKGLPNDHGGYHAAQGMGILIMGLVPIFIICSLASFASLPEMSYVKFKKEHADKVYEFYYKDKISQYKDYPRNAASRLKYGVVHYGKSWEVNGKYKELEKELYKKFPDAQRNVIYHPDIYNILNKDFLKCFSNDTIQKINNPKTIEEMQYDIGLTEENCLNHAAVQLINEIKSLKQETNTRKPT
jgi:hypothetical protein